MFASRLKALRLARGLTLDGLAEQMGRIITKQMLSRYECGDASPSPRVLEALAAALLVRPSQLQGEPAVEVQFIEFRKRATLGAKEQARIRHLVQFELEQRIRILDLVEPGARPLLPKPVRITSLDEVEGVSDDLRQQWRLGAEPIRCLVDTIEGHQVHVVHVEAPRTFDGLSARIVDTSSGKVVGAAVVSRSEGSGERQRLSLAHELGHVVLAPADGVDSEKAAFRFGGAFLAPAETLLREVGRRRTELTLDELRALRRIFGLSMQALVRRCSDLGIITETHYTDWFKRFSREGMRMDEGGEAPPERSDWVQRRLQRALAEGLVGEEEAAELLGTAAPPATLATVD